MWCSKLGAKSTLGAWLIRMIRFPYRYKLPRFPRLRDLVSPYYHMVCFWASVIATVAGVVSIFLSNIYRPSKITDLRYSKLFRWLCLAVRHMAGHLRYSQLWSSSSCESAASWSRFGEASGWAQTAPAAPAPVDPTYNSAPNVLCDDRCGCTRVDEDWTPVEPSSSSSAAAAPAVGVSQPPMPAGQEVLICVCFFPRLPHRFSFPSHDFSALCFLSLYLLLLCFSWCSL